MSTETREDHPTALDLGDSRACSITKRTLASWLTTAADRLIRNPEESGDGTRFVDLAPTNKADPSGVYSGALTEATNNPREMNIALAGPYQSVHPA
uniref:Uncharacterized protein n=1 Tax=Caulobacter sp. (strain K31) TaxID=366602 RepID=B0SYK2_CAUSK